MDEVCHSKEKGRLGIKKLHGCNDSFLMKIWLEPIMLWVKIIRTKYMQNYPNIFNIIPNKNGSHLWNSKRKVWSIFLRGLKWVVANRRSVSFGLTHRLKMDLLFTPTPTWLLFPKKSSKRVSKIMLTSHVIGNGLT